MSLEDQDRHMPILVVDDFSTMRRILKSCLHQMGFENVIEAEDGESALQKLNNQECKLVIADWNMPGMMGLELVRKIRAEDQYKNIPLLLVTAEGQQKTIDDAIDAGIDNYVVKPFTAEILQSKLEAVFSQK